MYCMIIFIPLPPVSENSEIRIPPIGRKESGAFRLPVSRYSFLTFRSLKTLVRAFCTKDVRRAGYYSQVLLVTKTTKIENNKPDKYKRIGPCLVFGDAITHPQIILPIK